MELLVSLIPSSMNIIAIPTHPSPPVIRIDRTVTVRSVLQIIVFFESICCCNVARRGMHQQKMLQIFQVKTHTKKKEALIPEQVRYPWLLTSFFCVVKVGHHEKGS